MSETAVLFAVLFAAFLHALWNTLVKGYGDKIVMMLTIAVVQTAIALLMIPFLGLPVPAAWPWLIAAAVPHTTYKIALAKAYELGDMSRVYPISRGLSIAIVTIASVIVLQEDVSPVGLLGIVTIGTGVIALSRKEGADMGHIGLRTAVLCAFAGASVALYSILDAIGVRVSLGDITLRTIATFAAWLFVLDGLGMVLFSVFYRGHRVFADVARTGLTGILAGSTAFACFWIAIWAFAYAPVALVAALRETSVLFSLVLGRVVLSECISLRRACFAMLVLTGIVMLRFA
ncbi:hypothetical protein [Stappia sp.]|uniref:hypothetical protein n=1 Tax=Stappia sp. TaxID=1870903 RepID=UPI003A9A4AC2